MDYEEWAKSRETAMRAWENGAKIKEIARILGVGTARAGQVVEKFRRNKRRHKLSESRERQYAAFLCLSDNGFSLDEIALFFDLDNAAAERLRSEAEVNAGRAEPHFSEVLELSVRAQNVLSEMRAETVADVAAASEAELLSTKGCGKLTVAEIKEQLDLNGLSLRP